MQFVSLEQDRILRDAFKASSAIVAPGRFVVDYRARGFQRSALEDLDRLVAARASAAAAPVIADWRERGGR